MELLLSLLVLYAVEGLLLLPPRAFAFTPCGRMRQRTEREGSVSSLPLRPGALTVFAAPLPLEFEGDRVRTTAPLGALGLPAPRDAAGWISCGALAPVEAAGQRVRVRGGSLLRAISRRHAAEIATLLHDLGRADTAGRHAPLVRTLAAAADPAALRERCETAQRSLRTSARVSDAYAMALFAGVPILLFATDAARTLWLGLGVVALLHVAALACGRAAHRALLPSEVASRREALLAAAIYPPSLLRLPQRIFLEAVGVPALAVAAATLATGETQTRLLRRALAESDHDAPTLPGEREALLLTLARAGIEPAVLRDAPIRSNSQAIAWCPRCFEEFRAGVPRCAECDVEVRRYAG